MNAIITSEILDGLRELEKANMPHTLVFYDDAIAVSGAIPCAIEEVRVVDRPDERALKAVNINRWLITVPFNTPRESHYYIVITFAETLKTQEYHIISVGGQQDYQTADTFIVEKVDDGTL
jgi:hypothetical protein